MMFEPSALSIRPADSILIEVGTSGGVVRGHLPLHGHQRMIDLLNSLAGPALSLTQSTLASGGQTAVAVVPRNEMLWVRPQEPQLGPVSPDERVEKVPRSVLLYVGQYELRGTAYTFARVRWVEYLEAVAGKFIALTGVRITSAIGTTDAPFVAVNGGRLSALLALEEKV